MDSDTFFEQVHDALVHVDDPLHLQTHPLAQLVSPEAARPESRGRALRQRLVDAVESLRPTRETPIASDASRRYQILHLRYVEGLEIAEVRKRLGLGRSEYFRDHRRALDAFASLLTSSLGSSGSGSESGKGAACDRVTCEKGAISHTGSGPRPRHNLPLQLTSFVGREREIAEVRRLLGMTRLLTLTGTGGCGKTRLAYQVAADLLGATPEEYPDGVWVVELASLSDPLLVPQAVHSALSLREELGRPILDTLVDYLRSKRLLLLLDNCEHVLDASARLADALLKACSNLRILATSREALGIAGETSYRVPSLALPNLEHLPPLADLAECESVCLLVERARAVLPSFHLTEEVAPAVAEVCWRLDGMPLAIELAAARVRGLSVDGIARRLDDRFRLLTGGSRTALRRQQTLRATIDWSYDLLSQPERCLFRRLAVFSGGWSLDAAEEVCSGEGGEAALERAEVLETLLRLVDRSLVIADAAAGDERYRLPETIRQYAQEKLQDSREMARLRDRHLDWCLGFLKSVRDLGTSADVSRFVQRLALEHDNLRAAQAWCLETNVALGLELAASTPYYSVLRDPGFAWEGRRWLRELLARAPKHSAARSRVLLQYYWLTSDEGDLDEAEAVAEEHLEVAREAGDVEMMIEALVEAGDASRLRGAHDRADSFLDEALAVARDAGRPSSVANVLGRRASVPASAGRYADARAYWEEAICLWRSLGALYEPRIANCAALLGFLDHVEGHHARGRALLEEGVAAIRRLGDQSVLGWSLSLLGCAVGREGDYGRGMALLRESLIVLRDLGHRLRIGRCLCFLAMLDRDRGDNARAARLIGAAMRIIGATTPEFYAYERTAREVCLAAARAALGEEAFARAWAEGQAMTLEQAVEYALKDDR